MRFPYRRVHFVGIGGIGMSALAKVLTTLGVEVTGTDISESVNVGMLRSLGIDVRVPHDPSMVGKGVELVVYSSAVPKDNQELLKAKELGIPLVKRGELLAMVVSQKESVVVAGSHGKTTTTAMVGKILWDAGKDPTIIVGGRLMDFESSNALIGSGNLIVAESDESDGSFLMLSPTTGILTNVDKEHLSHYGSFKELKKAFRKFLSQVRRHRVVCADDENAEEVCRNFEAIFYSVRSKDSHVYGEILEEYSEGTRFVYCSPWGIQEMFLPMTGVFNVQNALAAVTVCVLEGVDLDKAAESLAKFKGVERRLTVRGSYKGCLLVDDYAHHPTEIVNTLSAAKKRWPSRRMVVVFQPHRYTRMRDLWREFLSVFHSADSLWVTDVYSAGERCNGFNISSFLSELRERYSRVHFYPTWQEMVEPLKRELDESSVLITLGAGDVWKLCLTLAESDSYETFP